jgi:hypothetical protein
MKQCRKWAFQIYLCLVWADWELKSVVLLDIAKNIVLAGVKSVTLYDPTLVTLQDLSSQVFFVH